MERRRIAKRIKKGDGNSHLETKLQTYFTHKLSMQYSREDDKQKTGQKFWRLETYYPNNNAVLEKVLRQTFYYPPKQ
jgi:hypothetical protein